MPARSPWHAARGGGVRELRLRRRMTQADLGSVSNLQSTYISDVERGVRNPSWSVIVALSEALDTTPSNLLAVAERLANFL
jgi:transcriptional regulator with XRE-family HTH domain